MIRAAGTGAPTVVAGQCLRHRWKHSGCDACARACPVNALTAQPLPSIDPRVCTGCMLCASECPASALRCGQSFELTERFLAKIGRPILGCRNGGARGHATVACFGEIRPEHVVALASHASGPVTLNATRCSGCANGHALEVLQRRIDHIATLDLVPPGDLPRVVTTADGLDPERTPPGRRMFFNQIAQTLSGWWNPATDDDVDGARRRTIPECRRVLNRAVGLLGPAAARACSDAFDFEAQFMAGCDKCRRCVSVCPTGALQRVDDDRRLSFDVAACTGCRLCAEFCPESALSIRAVADVAQETSSEGRY